MVTIEIDRDSETFTVERFNIDTFTYKEALECAWHQLYCYMDKPIGQYIYPSKYDYLTLEQLKYRYRDPVERLKQMKRQAAMQDIALNHIAQWFMVEYYTSGMDLHVLRDQDRRIVGVSLWSHSSLGPVIDKQVGRVGAWVTLKRWWYNAKFAVSQWIDWVRVGEASMVNPRFGIFFNTAIGAHGAKWSTPEQLAAMSEDELRKAYQPMPISTFCFLHQVLPEYQRRGLGQKLMKAAIENVPHVKPEVQGKTLPQQFNLWATDEGKGMYEKCGWVAAGERFVLKDNGREVPSTDMYYLRD